MTAELPVQAQFVAYNAHDIEAFMACFSDDFKGYRMPTESPSTVGKPALREFYINNRFNNPQLKAQLITRTVLGNKVFDHEMIYGLSPEPQESVAVFEVENGLIKTAWFYFPS
ncbi:TPA: nuclear transport factor 2 family protein [Serratia rubidaea]|nr:nuclear transport factor 2 family protein [Serratia rubidaea]HDJ1446705.1 nuclear transport factor 2 family protein [Serratia rubidaea]HDJ1461052.1 nuclear transport factor 2 family protein [Serratia rubidaea]HDJ2770834.1 nuclear transport factor 2 family protein [Serratia rubidaea]